MAPITPQKNQIMDVSNSNATANWHRLLSLQTEMFLPYEINYLLNSQSWQKSKTVLDIGCGNGAYISQVSKFFPDKSYTAIDVSHDLIYIAKKAHAAKNIQFLNQSLEIFQTKKKYDIVIMRLIVQHLKDFPAVLSKTSSLLKPGGTLLIIEPDFDNFINYPATPEFNHLMLNIDKHSSKNQTNRHLLATLGEIATDTKNWGVAKECVTTAPFIGPFIGSNILQLYELWIDILEHSKILPISYGKVRDELSLWSKKPTAYSQIGIRFLLLESNPS